MTGVNSHAHNGYMMFILQTSAISKDSKKSMQYIITWIGNQ